MARVDGSSMERGDGGSGTRRGRVVADGQHLLVDGAPFRAKGVTYGSFAPRLDGELYPQTFEIKKDLVEMASIGVNVLRTYTVPPVDLLDLAAELGIYVLVGLHYRDWRYESEPGRRAQQRVVDAGRREIDRALERCAGRSEVLAVSIGNEVPCDVVRAHGIERVEDGLSALVSHVHEKSPDTLATYCNYPTTEFLRVEDQDLVCFNVFLERPEPFRRYVRHLQALSGDRPLLVAELGLASNLHGEEAQARFLREQLTIVDECGIAGATVFAWTDDWGVDGRPVEGWEFGVTTRDRTPKKAFEPLKEWVEASVRDVRTDWPQISVVVCVYNGERLLRKCLDSLLAVDYPALEVIVCDDGSTDRSAEIARAYPFEVMSLDRVGLSRARNAGIAAARGEIVAFLDADAFCHPEWPYHLALSLEPEGVVATGGPNLPVADAGVTEQAVAQSPGAPMEVLTADDRAEHVPGCNMAYKKSALLAVGGFNPIYTAAGDDVDVCWKILDSGWEIAFSHAAQVRHHRRDTAAGYLRQQRGYGRAEALLAPHHRHRFNRLGQARWCGVVYGGPRLLPRILRPVVYHGWSGSAAYQPVARRRSEAVRDWGVALMPLFVLAVIAGLVGSIASSWWLLVTGGGATAIVCLAAFVAAGATVPPGATSATRLRSLVAFFHLAQPLARTWGRLTTRRPVVEPSSTVWAGDRLAWLSDLEKHLAQGRHQVRFGGIHASWDIEVWRWSPLSWRATTAVLWGWTPVARVRPGLRIGPALVALVVIGFGGLVSGWGALIGAGMVGFSAQEALRVRRHLRRALRATVASVDG